MHAGERWTGELFAFDLCGGELRGAVAGLVGLGEIGSRVATLLRAFGATVLAFDPYPPPGHAAELGVELVSLPELLARSSIVSLHARLTDDDLTPQSLESLRPLAQFVDPHYSYEISHEFEEFTALAPHQDRNQLDAECITLARTWCRDRWRS